MKIFYALLIVFMLSSCAVLHKDDSSGTKFNFYAQSQTDIKAAFALSDVAPTYCISMAHIEEIYCHEVLRDSRILGKWINASGHTMLLEENENGNLFMTLQNKDTENGLTVQLHYAGLFNVNHQSLYKYIERANLVQYNEQYYANGYVAIDNNTEESVFMIMNYSNNSITLMLEVSKEIFTYIPLPNQYQDNSLASVPQL